MIFWIALTSLVGVGIFIGIKVYVEKKKRDKEAKSLEFVIGPITLK